MKTDVGSTTPKIKAILHVRPEMSQLFGSPTSGSTLISFFVDMGFFGNQTVVHDVFGKHPVLINVQPTNGGIAECLKKIRIYADKCMLDIFLAICREDNVGSQDKGLAGKLVHAICK